LIVVRRGLTVLIAGEQDLREDGEARGSLRRGSPQFPLLESMALSLHPAAVVAWTSNLALVVLLAACVEHQSLPSDPTGRLFARGLDEITDLYIAPVSDRKLILAGATRFSRLDDKFSVTESVGADDKTQVIMSYGGREVAAYPMPANNEPHAWGALMGHLVANAKAVSPIVAALSEDQIDKALFDGITSALDRFSRYAAPEIARDQRAVRDGFGGIGITLELSGEEFRIIQVTLGGPAELAGIRPNDRLVAVDGAATAGRSQSDVVHALRGPIFSSVEVTVHRPNLGQKRSFYLQRALVILPTVTMSRDGGVAVFQVASFNQNTTQQIVEDLGRLERESGQRLRGIILDLRGNPGGLLDQAVSLSDVFIPKGPIVATVGRHPASRQFFEASGDSIAPELPIVVLINGGSASSSEIVAAALQDVGRAVIVGSASYGKGTVQTVLRLPNDGELTLTWAQLVAPSGYLLHEHGVIPTLCTSDLGDDDNSVQIALQRTYAVGSPAPRARASLDEGAWDQLRRSCPARQGDHEIDIKVAKRLLADPTLFNQAVHALSATPKLAAAPPAPEPALTGAGGSLLLGPKRP
jgi:carboxyl-terminal processing protease